MGWERYLDELDEEFARRVAATRISEARELARVETSTVMLHQRLRKQIGADISLTLRNGNTIHLKLIRVASQWIYGQDRDESIIVPLDAVTVVRGLERVQQEVGLVDKKLSFAAALRRLTGQHVVLTSNRNVVWSGMLSTVWADHADLYTTAGTITVVLAELDSVAAGFFA